MIDLKDEKQKYYYIGKCLLQEDIDFYTFKIYHPIVKEIMNINEDDYSKILQPYVFPLNGYKGLTGEETLFDAICSNSEMFSFFILSLSYFCRLDIDKDIIVKNKFDKKLNRNKIQVMVKGTLFNNRIFEELKQIIMMVCNVKELKIKENKPISKRKQRLLELRKQHKNEDITYKRVKLVNVYNYVVHQDNVVDYDKWMNYSIYRIYNSYNNLIQKENVRFTYDVVSHGFGGKDTNLEPYVDKIIK